MNNYNELLKSPEWKKKRAVILKRDNYKCQKCLSTTNLHVHHIWYIPNKMPWEVPNNYLITLCEICHNKEHEGKSIKEFKLKKQKKSNKPKSKAAKKQDEINKLYLSLNKQDRLLQAKYDKLKTKN